ncbi:UNVERIFIED_CONTAM: hypothetical protein Sangu_2948600 [Sesamum angustifolium]|uniref:Uncharacterized protein n=1 Tax=Sesamum angustifolium TaxID=2727405 RepID=A0AAW2IKX0_9LAMI
MAICALKPKKRKEDMKHLAIAKRDSTPSFSSLLKPDAIPKVQRRDNLGKLIVYEASG